jgi:hypothetical protein
MKITSEFFHQIRKGYVVFTIIPTISIRYEYDGFMKTHSILLVWLFWSYLIKYEYSIL